MEKTSEERLADELEKRANLKDMMALAATASTKRNLEREDAAILREDRAMEEALGRPIIDLDRKTVEDDAMDLSGALIGGDLSITINNPDPNTSDVNADVKAVVQQPVVQQPVSVQPDRPVQSVLQTVSDESGSWSPLSLVKRYGIPLAIGAVTGGAGIPLVMSLLGGGDDPPPLKPEVEIQKALDTIGVLEKDE